MLKVLLVDDEPFIVQGLQAMIEWEKFGCEVLGNAANGSEALEFLKENEVDLIIADICMPVMTGLELLEKLRTEKISDAWFVILSGYNDFQYAQQAIRYECMDYVLKPVQKEEIEQILQKVCQMQTQKEERAKEREEAEALFIGRNLRHLLNGKQEEDTCRMLSRHFAWEGKMRYVIIESGPVDETIQEKPVAVKELLLECSKLVGENWKGCCVIEEEIFGTGNSVGLIFCEKMAKERNMGQQEYLLWLQEELNQRICGFPMLFVGCETEAADHLAESVKTAVAVRTFCAFRPRQAISWYELEEQMHAENGVVLCKEVLDTLIRVTEENQKEEIEQQTEKLYEEMGKMGMEVQTVQLNINYLLFGLVHLAVKQDSEICQEEVLEMIREKISRMEGIQGSCEYMKQLILEYAQYLAELRKNVSRGVLAQVDKEIRENYEKNLTLKELSQKYFVNSAYLGQLFRKKYGMPFKDYLNNYRLEKAAELLLHTDKKIYEIAELVGYHDLDYFINRFIAEKGCTPSRFRKQALESR